MCTYTFTLPHELGRTHSPIWRDTDAHTRPHVPSTPARLIAQRFGSEYQQICHNALNG